MTRYRCGACYNEFNSETETDTCQVCGAVKSALFAVGGTVEAEAPVAVEVPLEPEATAEAEATVEKTGKKKE
jgi:hypothetical protein